jgi:glycosyltransferase involved in cell wall biosynthesis
VAQCAQEGLDARLVVVGDGRFQRELQVLARSLGVANRVDFYGQLPAGVAVRAVLDEADLFLLPSRTEGLPRSMVEAMARALPCIGSSVGGIPDLLSPEDLVPPGDVAALAAKICQVARDPDRLARMSSTNLAVAQTYRETLLRERRATFYRRVREETEKWLKGEP